MTSRQARSARAPGADARGLTPVVATSRKMARTVLLFYGTGALVAFLLTFGAQAPGAHVPAMRLIAGCAAVGGGLAGIGVTRYPAWVYQTFNVLGTTAVTALIVLSRGGSVAAALAVLYIFVPLDSCFFFRWRAAALLQMYGFAACIFAWRIGALAWGEVVALVATQAVAAFVVGWLVRAASSAEVDELTGLLNMRGMDHILDTLLAPENARVEHVTVALLDLDHFRQLNEGRGRAAGNEVLRATAEAWSAALPPDATLARDSADRFLVLLPSGVADGTGWQVFDELRRLTPTGHTCSVGYAEWEPGDTASLLLSRADAALYQAKRAGRNTVRPQPARVTRRELRAAIDCHQLMLAYQPIVNIDTGDVAGAEVLVRWQHPVHGLLLPGEFLPFAEETGLVGLIDRQGLREAVATVAHDLGPATRISVNASGAFLLQPDVVEVVEDALRSSGLPAECLVLEVTESTLAADSVDVVGTLTHLRALGVRIAIDDFGTGYSSLARLSSLPVDVLKIDRAFVETIGPNGQLPPVVATILALASQMNLSVVAEGIEHPYQQEALRSRPIPGMYGQGWLFGKPGPIGVLRDRRPVLQPQRVPEPRQDAFVVAAR